jgi:hypothetical protein
MLYSDYFVLYCLLPFDSIVLIRFGTVLLFNEAHITPHRHTLRDTSPHPLHSSHRLPPFPPFHSTSLQLLHHSTFHYISFLFTTYHTLSSNPLLRLYALRSPYTRHQAATSPRLPYITPPEHLTSSHLSPVSIHPTSGYLSRQPPRTVPTVSL